MQPDPIREWREQYARRCLRVDFEPLDVALRVGFSDISYFNRLFRFRFGDTPKGVRANQQAVRYAN
jgi:AraC-like DNA-binding protein